MSSSKVKALKYCFGFLAILAVASCRTRQAAAVVKQDTSTVITETIHDTVFHTERDSSAYRALLECQKGKVVVKEVQGVAAGKYLKAPVLNIKDNIVNCDCEAEKQALRAQLKNKNKTIIKEVEKPIFITQELTKWESFLIGLGKIMLILILCAITYGLFRLYKKLKP